jgi:TonB family protein
VWIAGCALFACLCASVGVAAESPFDSAYRGYEAALERRDAAGVLSHARTAFELGRDHFGDDHETTAILRVNLADAYMLGADYEAAEPHYHLALRVLERARGPDHVDLLLPIGDLAFIHQRRGAVDLAREFHRRAIRIHEKDQGPQSPAAASRWVTLALLEDAAGKQDVARRYHERALEIRQSALSENSAELAESLFFVAKYDLEAEHWSEAREGYVGALRIWRSSPPGDGRIEPAARDQLARANHMIVATRVEESELIERVQPRFPQRMAERGISGWVEIEFSITAAGTVANPVVVAAEPAEGFNNAALDAVSKWRYVPRRVGGKPEAETGKQVVVRFNVGR